MSSTFDDVGVLQSDGRSDIFGQSNLNLFLHTEMFMFSLLLRVPDFQKVRTACFHNSKAKPIKTQETHNCISYLIIINETVQRVILLP